MESNHVVPRHQRGAVTVWLTPLACWWSQERSNLLLPGFDRPLHHQSFRTMSLLGNRAIEGASALQALTHDGRRFAQVPL